MVSRADRACCADTSGLQQGEGEIKRHGRYDSALAALRYLSSRTVGFGSGFGCGRPSLLRWEGAVERDGCSPGLAGWAPVESAAGQVYPLDDGAADEAGLAMAVVDVVDLVALCFAFWVGPVFGAGWLRCGGPPCRRASASLHRARGLSGFFREHPCLGRRGSGGRGRAIRHDRCYRCRRRRFGPSGERRWACWPCGCRRCPGRGRRGARADRHPGGLRTACHWASE